jgi:hypothetical protein
MMIKDGEFDRDACGEGSDDIAEGATKVNVRR